MGSHIRSTVNGEVFGRGNRFEIMGGVALHSPDECCSHLSRQKGVFSVSFLPASPPRIAKNINIRRPICEPKIIEVVVLPLRLVVLGAALYCNHPAFAMDEVGVPGGSHSNGLGKHGGISRTPHAVQG